MSLPSGLQLRLCPYGFPIGDFYLVGLVEFSMYDFSRNDQENLREVVITRKILRESFLSQFPFPAQIAAPLPQLQHTHTHTPTTDPQSLPMSKDRGNRPEAKPILGDCHLDCLYPSFSPLPRGS